MRWIQSSAELAEWRADLTGVRGQRPNAVAFADAWHAATGRAGRIRTEERLYRLGTLRAPNAVTGNSRLATEDDRGQARGLGGVLLRRNLQPSSATTAAGERFVDNAKAVGDRFVLWDVDGTPVSMAMLRAPRPAYRGSGRSSRRWTRVATATARPSPPRPQIWHTAAARRTSCSSPISPIRCPTPSISASASSRSAIQCASTSSRPHACDGG